MTLWGLDLDGADVKGGKVPALDDAGASASHREVSDVSAGGAVPVQGGNAAPANVQGERAFDIASLGGGQGIADASPSPPAAAGEPSYYSPPERSPVTATGAEAVQGVPWGLGEELRLAGGSHAGEPGGLQAGVTGEAVGPNTGPGDQAPDVLSDQALYVLQALEDVLPPGAPSGTVGGSAALPARAAWRHARDIPAGVQEGALEAARGNVEKLLERYGFSTVDALDARDYELLRQCKVEGLERLLLILEDPNEKLGPIALSQIIQRISQAEKGKIDVVTAKIGKLNEQSKPGVVFRARIGIARTGEDGKEVRAVVEVEKRETK